MTDSDQSTSTETAGVNPLLAGLDGDTRLTREGAQTAIDQHPFLSWLDVRVEAVADGRVVLAVPHHDRLCNTAFGADTIHGGVTATLVDTIGAFALYATVEDLASLEMATTDLNVSYMRPATGRLEAEGTVLRAGNSMGVVDVTITSETDGDRVESSHGRVSYRLFR